MKTNQLLYRCLTFLILIMITFSFNGCSDSDDKNESDKTFLEKFDKTTWIDIDESGEGDFTIIRFNNNTTNTIEDWNFNTEDGNCWWYNHHNEASFGVSGNISDLEDKLIIISTEDDFSETLTFTTQSENTIKLVDNWVENGISSEEIYYFEKTSEDVDNLNTCN